jgi:hypothetical protein
MVTKTTRACATLLVATLATGCANYREVTLADGAVVLGSTRGLPVAAEFFSVRVGHRWSGGPLRTSARLHLRDRELLLQSLTPADLQRLGVAVDSDLYATAGLQVASLGYGDQNRDGALEFYFSGGRLREFYARCHVAGRCGYELSWPSRGRFRLPIAEAGLVAHAGPPASVRDYYGQ